MSQYSIRRSYEIENGDSDIRRRTEKGWTLDFVFSGNTTGTTFYFLGFYSF